MLSLMTSTLLDFFLKQNSLKQIYLVINDANFTSATVVLVVFCYFDNIHIHAVYALLPLYLVYLNRYICEEGKPLLYKVEDGHSFHS